MWFFNLFKTDVTQLVKNDIAILEILAAVHNKLIGLTGEIKEMSQELDTLKAQVASAVTVENSAVALINGLADKIKAAGNDTATLQAIAAELDALTNTLKTSSETLAATVAANTPPTV